MGNLEKRFLEVLNRHAPLQRKKIRAKRIPWLTSPIKELINTRDKLKRKAIITNLEYDWENYKRIRNRVNIELKKRQKRVLSHENC